MEIGGTVLYCTVPPIVVIMSDHQRLVVTVGTVRSTLGSMVVRGRQPVQWGVDGMHTHCLDGVYSFWFRMVLALVREYQEYMHLRRSKTRRSRRQDPPKIGQTGGW